MLRLCTEVSDSATPMRQISMAAIAISLLAVIVNSFGACGAQFDPHCGNWNKYDDFFSQLNSVVKGLISLLLVQKRFKPQ